MRCAHFALVLATLTVSACGGVQSSRTFYETTTIQHPPITQAHRGKLVQMAKSIAKKGKLKQKTASGQIRTVSVTEAARLNLATLGAIHLMRGAKQRGGEADLMVSVKGKGRVPVTVTTDLKGGFTFETSPRPQSPQRRKVWIPRFKNGDATWSDAHRRALALAVSQITPAEAKVLEGMTLIRYKRAKDGRKGALYVQKNCAAHIRIYNRAFEADRWQFVGSPQRPLPSSTRTVLHEVGHAIHNQPSRVAFCAYEKKLAAVKARINAYNANLKRARRTRDRRLAAKLARESKALTALKAEVEAQSKRAVSFAKRGPVLDAFDKAMAGKTAPTSYGQSSLRESFAESYSLFRSDPAALKRLLPRVYQWFANGGHIRAMP